jgi:hypothetical protein
MALVFRVFEIQFWMICGERKKFYLLHVDALI